MDAGLPEVLGFWGNACKGLPLNQTSSTDLSTCFRGGSPHEVLICGQGSRFWVEAIGSFRVSAQHFRAEVLVGSLRCRFRLSI